MKIKCYFLLAIVVFFLFNCVKEAEASIVTVGKIGEVTINILSAEDSSSDIPSSESVKISKSSVEMGDADMPISLFRKDGKYMLNISGKNGEKSFDVTNYRDRILEIEERPSVKKIAIGLSENQFVIEQDGIKAKTIYQINIEPQRSRITILTPTGYKFLTMMPQDAVDVLLKSKSITSLGGSKTIDISEDMDGNLFYQISGVKKVGIKDVYMYDAPVSAKISVVDGEILEIDQPIWLKILSLFVIQT
jgi:hypothetical protein